MADEDDANLDAGWIARQRDGSFSAVEAVASLEGDLKIEATSPTNFNQRFSFSRTSSTGSIHGIGTTSSASSAHNSDDDDDSDSSKQPMSYKDRRREAHTQAEQKRRDAIKKGYDDLQNLVPSFQQSDGLTGQKVSKATILQKSIDYIQFLVNQKKKQEEELDSLRKEVMALKIMKANYEHIVKAHKNTPVHGQNQVSDEVKFQVFKQMMDSLFTSFNLSISVANFAELSGCVFSWLEEYCKPHSLRHLLMDILGTVNKQLPKPPS
ncbi:max-like protein X [Tubulanus polymorphus]|uniref:max-like protein X n=1 Tax=Tubulanus polymorphus TaxID=672921 RepID=UPI003DA1CB65